MRNVLLISYILLCFFLILFSYLFIDRNLLLFNRFYSGFSLQNRSFAAVIFVIFITFLTILYYRSILNAKKNNLSLPSIKKLVAIVSTILFFSYPAMLSYDIFNYILTAKVAFLYHENPYIVMPVEFIGDSNLAWTRAANKIALYGPSWIALTAIPHFLSFNNIILAILSFKAVALLFYLATLKLIFKLTKNTLSVVLFALSPLVLIETLVSAHNDIVMIFFALLSFYLLSKKKIFWAAILIILSIFIKYATILLLPIFIYVVLKTLKKEKVNWNKIFYFSAWLMLIAFLMSLLRGEIYPWYAIWPLSLAVLVPQRKFLLSLTLTLSISVLFRYIPELYTGSYFGITPIVRELVTFVPVTIFVCMWITKKFLWLKNSR